MYMNSSPQASGQPVACTELFISVSFNCILYWHFIINHVTVIDIVNCYCMYICKVINLQYCSGNSKPCSVCMYIVLAKSLLTKCLAWYVYHYYYKF